MSSPHWHRGKKKHRHMYHTPPLPHVYKTPPVFHSPVHTPLLLCMYLSHIFMPFMVGPISGSIGTMQRHTGGKSEEDAATSHGPAPATHCTCMITSGTTATRIPRLSRRLQPPQILQPMRAPRAPSNATTSTTTKHCHGSHN